MKNSKLFVCNALLVAVAALMMWACQKDDSVVNLKLSVSRYVGNEKTYVDSENYSCWSGNGEMVNINGEQYAVTVAGNRASIANVPVCNSGYAAVYPASIVTGTVGGNSSVAVTLPAEQTYVEHNGAQELQSPMAAWTSGNELSFANVCSLVKVTVCNDTTIDLTLKDITLTADNVALSGTASIALGSSPSLTMTADDEASHSVRLSFWDNEEVLAPGASKSYLVSVPQIATASRISIAVRANTKGSNHRAVRSQNAVTLAANHIVDGPSCSPRPLTDDSFFGAGTQADPFVVENQNDLDILRVRCTGGHTYAGKYFSVVRDIVCTRPHHAISYLNNASCVFNGIFNGNNHAISLSSVYSLTNTCGLFGNVGANAQLRNIHVTGTFAVNFNASQTYPFFGAICATADAACVVDGCTCSANITNVSMNNGGSSSTWRIGGIVGSGAVDVTNCSFTGSMVLNGGYKILYVGGIRGACAEGGEVVGCTSNGTINVTNTYNGTSSGAMNAVGGVAGCNYRADISNCTNNTSITTSAKFVTYVGGVAGQHGSLYGNTITNCRNEAAIVATCQSYNIYAGGLVGYVEHLNMTGCSNSGNVTASSGYNVYVGGMVGSSDNKDNVVTLCSNSGTLSATGGNGRLAYCAGIIACNEMQHLRNLSNSGGVTATARAGTAVAGGIVNQGTRRTTTSYLYNSFNTGSVSASGTTVKMGGVMGDSRLCTTANCYNAGTVGANGFGVLFDNSTTAASYCYWLSGCAQSGTNYSGASCFVDFSSNGTLSSGVAVGSHAATTSLLQALNDWKNDNGANYASWVLGSNGLPKLQM